MGPCMSCCVRSATYVHDRYSSWKWKRDELFDREPPGLPPPPPRNRTIEAAVIDKNISEIKRLASEDPSAINIVNSLGESPLHLACKLGYLHIVDELLQQGADPNIVTSIGTPIHCALKAVKTDYIKEEDGVCLIKKLASQGCDIEAVDRGLKTALFCTAELQLEECMKTLLHLGAFVNCIEANCFSPLYMSVIQGDLDCVKLLLSQVGSIEVDLRDSAGRSPLLASLITVHNNLKNGIPGNSAMDCLERQKFRRIVITEALLWAGADPNLRDNYNRVALNIIINILEAENIHRLYRCKPTDPFTEKTSSDEGYQSVSVFGGLIRLLVLCGADIAPFKCQVAKYFEEVASWLEGVTGLGGCDYAELVSSHAERPFKLAHSCRMVIRGHLASINKLHRVQQLPIPQKLRDYLAIMYL